MDWKIRSYKDLGIRTDNLISSLVPWVALTTVFAVGLIFILQQYPTLTQLFFQLYPSVVILIILAVLQEVFFRGYLIKILRGFFKNPAVVIVIDAILFALMHFIFPQWPVLVPEAFIAGIGFAWIYYYHPNLIWASVSHALLNWMVIPYCTFHLIRC